MYARIRARAHARTRGLSPRSPHPLFYFLYNEKKNLELREEALAYGVFLCVRACGIQQLRPCAFFYFLFFKKNKKMCVRACGIQQLRPCACARETERQRDRETESAEDQKADIKRVIKEKWRTKSAWERNVGQNAPNGM